MKPFSIRYIGDTSIAILFIGDAMNLLWSVKNGLNISGQKTVSRTRTLVDGTIIRIDCLHGQDIILIDSSSSTLSKGVVSCSIVLIDLPATVAPMQYPGEIHEGETSPNNYLKLYYQILSICKNCQPVKWQITMKQGIISVENYFAGEIVNQGSDSNGTYLNLKFYTENTNFDRSGQSIMTLKGSINKADGTQLCAVQKDINVDCCAKTDLKPVKIYWPVSIHQQLGLDVNAQDVVSFEGIDLCMPPIPPAFISIDKWRKLKLTDVDLYAIPEVGGCPGYKWSMVGLGTLTLKPDAESTYNRIMDYIPPSPNFCQTVKISVVDRCKPENPFTIQLSCCDHPDTQPLNILYTSLQMSGGQSQTLTASGGCGPYTWSLSPALGTLTDNGDGTALYTAPDSNPGCQNPVVTLTDCCGKSVTIKLAINFGGFSGQIAYWYLHWYPSGGGIEWYVDQKFLYCDNSVTPNTVGWWFCQVGSEIAIAPPTQPPAGSMLVGESPGLFPCASQSYVNFYQPDTWNDIRTDDMKNGGCCPVNPDTGLPF